jgi:hypothetical protein
MPKVSFSCMIRSKKEMLLFYEPRWIASDVDLPYVIQDTIMWALKWSCAPTSNSPLQKSDSSSMYIYAWMRIGSASGVPLHIILQLPWICFFFFVLWNFICREQYPTLGTCVTSGSYVALGKGLFARPAVPSALCREFPLGTACAERNCTSAESKVLSAESWNPVVRWLMESGNEIRECAILAWQY